ncbi:hypothetical protein ACAG39_02005 [Caldicellulosiruptoraceae bacterium PP1]
MQTILDVLSQYFADKPYLLKDKPKKQSIRTYLASLCLKEDFGIIRDCKRCNKPKCWLDTIDKENLTSSIQNYEKKYIAEKFKGRGVQ